VRAFIGRELPALVVAVAPAAADDVRAAAEAGAAEITPGWISLLPGHSGGADGWFGRDWADRLFAGANNITALGRLE